MSTFIQNFSTIGHLSNEKPEHKIQKSFLVFLATFMSFGGVLWGSIAFFNGMVIPSLIPFSYVIISALNIAVLAFTKKFRFVRIVQVLISLLLPVFFQWSLGGFLPSGGIILWSVLALIASLSFENFQNSLIWLTLFLTACIVSYFFDTTIYGFKPEQLGDSSLLFMFLNITVISSIIYGLVLYFVTLNIRSRKALEVSSERIKGLNNDLRKKFEELEIAQKKMQTLNNELQESKNQLTEITKRQIQINEQLLKDQNMI